MSPANCTSPSMRTAGRSPRSAAWARSSGDDWVTSRRRSGVAASGAMSNSPAGVTCRAMKNWRHCTRTTRPRWGCSRCMATLSCISTWLSSSTTRCCTSCTSHWGGCGPAAMRSKTLPRKEKGDCVAIVPDYSLNRARWARMSLKSLQCLHARHQPAARAALGLGHVPDLAEGAGACGGLLADHAGELDAGHVGIAQVFDTQQLGFDHDHVGLVGLLAAMRFALGQLGTDLAQHGIGHHGAQRGHVGTVPGGLERDEIALGRFGEAGHVKALGHAPVLRAGQSRADHRTAAGRLARGIKGHAAALPGAGRGGVADLRSEEDTSEL